MASDIKWAGFDLVVVVGLLILVIVVRPSPWWSLVLVGWAVLAYRQTRLAVRARRRGRP